MDGFSVRYYDAPEVEIGSCALRVPPVLGDDPELPDLAEGWRFQSQTARDDERFERAWFVDFRERWRAALRLAHEQFLGRLADITHEGE